MFNLLTTENKPKIDNIEPKIYNLLSIGQRGVGKTVFLAGSYAQFKAEAQKNPLVPLWLECEAQEARENIEKVLGYIARTGQYPPATMKIANFDFSLQQNRSWGQETVGRVCWWDTPGESCQIYNPAFLNMVIHAQGCCLFLDAQALAKQADNPQELEILLSPIEVLCSILDCNGLKPPLALILTKCDLLEAKTVNWQSLKKSLSPLTDAFRTLDINYRIFYSEISLELVKGVPSLKSVQTSAPLIWLVEEMKKADRAMASSITPNYTPKKAPLTGRISESWRSLLSLKRSQFLLFLSLILVGSLIGFISLWVANNTVNSEQNSPLPASVQSDN